MCWQVAVSCNVRDSAFRFVASVMISYCLPGVGFFLFFRKNKRIEFLNGLNEGWNCLSTLQILLLRLQRARADERPMIAVVLLELDLLVWSL